MRGKTRGTASCGKVACGDRESGKVRMTIVGGKVAYEDAESV